MPAPNAHQPHSRTARIGLRATAEQEGIFRRAAEVSRKSIEFVPKSACAAAEETLLDQRLSWSMKNSGARSRRSWSALAEIKPRLARAMA